MSLAKHLKALFGGSRPAPKPTAKKALATKGARTYVTSTTDRAKLIAEAMAVYRRERAQMQAGLDSKLAELRAAVPKVLHDPVALGRLLSLHRAHVDLRRMMASDHKRFLVLSGMRELLGELPSPAKKRGIPAAGHVPGRKKSPKP